MQITTIGLIWISPNTGSKSTASRPWTRCRSPAAVAERCDRLLPVARAVSGRHGSLCNSALLGA